MKALSLTQPYASAIVHQIKRYETRGWPTSYRGELCIHASKGFPKWAREFADIESLRFPQLDELPLGMIVGVCDLTACYQTATLAPTLSYVEDHWGDYAPGRFAFKIENVRILSEPVPVKGMLGIWNVPHDVAEKVLSNLREG